MIPYTNMFPGVVARPLPVASSCESRVLEGSRFEFNIFDSCIFARKLKLGELLASCIWSVLRRVILVRVMLS